jgi:hypothetical protein
MCQAYEAEQRAIFSSERADRRKALEDHESGKKTLTQEEITRLMVEELMARDAGF